MSEPTREEVQAFIDALKYGMKVSHKPEFLLALAEGWLNSEKIAVEDCATSGKHTWHVLEQYHRAGDAKRRVVVEKCSICGKIQTSA